MRAEQETIFKGIIKKSVYDFIITNPDRILLEAPHEYDNKTFEEAITAVASLTAQALLEFLKEHPDIKL